MSKGWIAALLCAMCLSGTGCMSVLSCFDAVHPVWTEDSRAPIDLPPPEGFTVTPAEAEAIVVQSRRLCLKHIWHVYADAECYFVHDAFFFSNSARAARQGVRVHGKTGDIWDRQTKAWIPSAYVSAKQELLEGIERRSQSAPRD